MTVCESVEDGYPSEIAGGATIELILDITGKRYQDTCMVVCWTTVCCVVCVVY